MVIEVSILSLIVSILTRQVSSVNNTISNTNMTENGGLLEPIDIDYRSSFGFLYADQNCRLRSKKFISNGLCTSPKPIKEVVCAESCLMPSGTRVPFSFHLNSLRRKKRSSKNNNTIVQQKKEKLKWKCIEASVRRKRVKLLCHDGTIRSYTLTLIMSCQCTPITGRNRTE